MISDEHKIFPEIDGIEWIVGYWYELGLASSNGMGQVPLSYTEIDAYSRLSGVDMSPFEVDTIRKMSNAYCSSIVISKEKGAFPPYPKYKEVNVSEKLKTAFDVLRKK